MTTRKVYYQFERKVKRVDVEMNDMLFIAEQELDKDYCMALINAAQHLSNLMEIGRKQMQSQLSPR